jgi:hypothetical protein
LLVALLPTEISAPSLGATLLFKDKNRGVIQFFLKKKPEKLKIKTSIF